MTIAAHVAALSRAASRTGWVLSGILILFLVVDGAIKLVPIQVVLDTMAELGWPADPAKARILGVLTLGCAILYAVPRTSVLGAILLTGYLGGAMATHMRIDNPLFSHLLFGLYLGVIAWGGLWLREPRMRALIPLKS
ncbi:MAG: DoxX family protein [Phreatobacter sp.]|uniref:DoxX family protein n=1 Tax=Phreatobacter sp. TaxID=1966341 RepID=UPI001A3F4BA0|nr:DoxX family protein [Phreatobacter sp.]MBL8569395.1 DoxX family protein [Phreatobacter sp.]